MIRVIVDRDPHVAARHEPVLQHERGNTAIGENTLGGIRGNTAYLIHSSAATNINLTLTGVVSHHTYSWVPDSYNLFGNPIGNGAP